MGSAGGLVRRERSQITGGSASTTARAASNTSVRDGLMQSSGDTGSPGTRGSAKAPSKTGSPNSMDHGVGQVMISDSDGISPRTVSSKVENANVEMRKTAPKRSAVPNARLNMMSERDNGRRGWSLRRRVNISRPAHTSTRGRALGGSVQQQPGPRGCGHWHRCRTSSPLEWWLVNVRCRGLAGRCQ